MSKIDVLKSYVNLETGSIRFLPVEVEDVNEAEVELGFSLPLSLKRFYSSIGYGWLGDDTCADVRNLIIHPLDIVDLYKCESEFSPLDVFLDGDLPILDCGGDKFLVVRPNSQFPDRVYRDDGGSVALAEDVGALALKLLNSPTFYFE